MNHEYRTLKGYKLRDHREITDAIARHDPQAARRAMEAHIVFNRDNISLILSGE